MTSNTVIQSLVSEDKRARVISYYTMAFFGAAPFGSLLAGALAHVIGAPHAVIITGVFCIAGSLWFTFEWPKTRTGTRPQDSQPTSTYEHGENRARKFFRT